MLMKIGNITSKFGISHRSLHYWEDMGIIKSSRAENDYRYYDEENQRKIEHILILRKLRIPLKQIILVLESENTIEMIETFQQNLNSIDDEITALSTIRSILAAFITKLNENMMIDLKVNLLDDSSILEIVDSLSVIKPGITEFSEEKKEKMDKELIKADNKLSKITDDDIRIIYIPPATVASALGIGDEAEHEADVIMSRFINDSDLFKTYPNVKLYGFNNPIFNQNGDFVQHQYEVWATIPDNLQISEPLIKKHFDGGLYAAFTSKPLNFDEWKLFGEWLSGNQDFEYDNSRAYRDVSDDFYVRCSGWGCLEEHFNSYNLYGLKSKKHILSHIDFLIPIKERAV